MSGMATKPAPTLIQPIGSHWLELSRNYRSVLFEREGLYPVLELDVARVGVVRAQFSVDRYVSSVWHEATQTETREWGDWRIILRDVRDVPAEGETFGREASGVGPATRETIRAACTPVIRAWLETSGYRSERRKAAAYAVKRALVDAAGSSGYSLERARQTLEAAESELAPMTYASYLEALGHLEQAEALLDREPVG